MSRPRQVRGGDGDEKNIDRAKKWKIYDGRKSEISSDRVTGDMKSSQTFSMVPGIKFLKMFDRLWDTFD